MLGIALDHFRLECPVFVDLRAHLHIVAVNVCAGKSLVRSARQHSLQSVTELMERGLHLVDGQQRRRSGGGLREVAHIIYYRTTHVAVGIYSGSLHLLHPGALALGVAGEIVAHPHGHMLAGLGVHHVIYLHVLHIFGSIGHRHQFDAVQFLGGVEQPLQHLVHAEVGTKVSLVEVILLLLYLVGIIVIIPGCDGDVVSMLVCVSLHVLHLLVRALHGRLEHLHQQVGGVFGSFGHHTRRHHACEILEAHDVGLLVAQLHNLGDDGQVGVVAIRSQAGVALVDGFAQTAVVGILQHGESARGMEGEYPQPLQAALLGLLGGYGHRRLGQTRQVVLVIYHNGELVGGVQQVAVILYEQL